MFSRIAFKRIGVGALVNICCKLSCICFWLMAISWICLCRLPKDGAGVVLPARNASAAFRDSSASFRASAWAWAISAAVRAMGSVPKTGKCAMLMYAT